MTEHLTTPIPPHNLDAEESVLGAMLISPTAIEAVSDILAGNEFYRASHTKIYRACLALYDRGDSVDELTVADHLEHTNQTDETCSRDRVHELGRLAPAVTNVSHYARIVKEKSQLRSLISAGHDIARLGWEHPAPIDDLLNDAQQRVFDLATGGDSNATESAGKVLREVFAHMERLAEAGNDIIGTATGYRQLDQLTSGLEAGQLVILAARPGMGKSSLATAIAANVAFRQGKPAAIFSLEMSKHEISQRLLSREGHIPLAKIRTPGRGMTTTEWQTIAATIQRLEQAPLLIHDRRGLTLTALRAELRRVKSRCPDLGFVVVDYLQLMTADAENRTQEITKISRGLKTIAGDINVPILALSQLNRGVENRQDKRPQLADLRESGSIEADADIVLFLYRDGYYNKDSLTPDVTELSIAKQRNGALGTCRLMWRGPHATFTEEHPG